MPGRIGILTGGGDCPGLNAVIRAVTLHAQQAYGWDVVGIHNGFEGLYDGRNVALDARTVESLLPRGGTILGATNHANPFAYRVPTPAGRGEIQDVSARCLANLAKLELRGLIVVGGDGTMGLAHRFMGIGAGCIVGVPKTIDNDLDTTDYTVGFQTAVETVVDALERLETTAASHERVMVVEVMGRYAGWIALTSAIAGGAHVCLIPELDYDLARVIAAVDARRGLGHCDSIIVIAEGAKPRGGTLSVATSSDGTREQKLGGAGQRLAEQLAAHSAYDVRSTVLGHIQRGGSPCAFDRELATRFGVKAVEMIAAGELGQMTAFDHGCVVAKPIARAIAKPKIIDLAGELVRTARGIGIELGAGVR